MIVIVDAWTLEATVRITNIEFTDDLYDTSSQAYLSLKQNFTDEVPCVCVCVLN